ncbi:MAG: Holliday junction resolvase-like protein [Candidatus Aenigmatarchaeota archaeon]
MEIEIILGVFIIILAFVIYYHVRANRTLRQNVTDLISRRQSLASKYGKMSEQFMPFMKSYPYDEHNFRFLGTPIDGVQFEDDKIVFVEFKTSGSKLSEKQKKIKDLVEKKKVEWNEVRME